MGDFWSGTTKYDLQAGNRRKNASSALASRNQVNQGRIDAIGGGFQQSGTEAERDSQASGMEMANTGYGQGLGQTGQDIQRLKQLQQQRTGQSGGDPVSAAIMGQKAGAMAGAQRNMAASGVKGGAAAGALDAVGRQRDADIAASLYGQQRQSIADERSMASNMLAGTVAMSQGGKAEGTAQAMPKAPETGGMGTVICSELYRQGVMPKHIYALDVVYGHSLYVIYPEVTVGYHLWAKPLVKVMKKSKLVTKLVSIPAMAWARNMAGDYNFFGSVISMIGEPICNIVGKVKLSFSGAKYVV